MALTANRNRIGTPIVLGGAIVFPQKVIVAVVDQSYGNHESDCFLQVATFTLLVMVVEFCFFSPTWETLSIDCNLNSALLWLFYLGVTIMYTRLLKSLK
jgi:hypothetical protein